MRGWMMLIRSKALRYAAIIIVSLAIGGIVGHLAVPPTVVEKKIIETVPEKEIIPEKYRKIMDQLPDYYPVEYWKTIEAAEKEGEILVYSIMSVENWAPLIEEFNKLYPFLKVTTLDLGSYEVFDRYLIEVAAGKPSADMIISAAPEVFPIFIKEHAIKYVSPEATFYPTVYILDWMLYVFDATPSVMVYNKLLLPKDKVPDGYAQLAEFIKSDPKFWEGKVTSYDIRKSAFGSNMAYFLIKRHGDKAWEWIKDISLAKPVTYASTGPMVEKIATGEHLIGFFISWMVLAPKLEKAPEIYGVIYPKEGVVVAMRAAVIPNKAPHPNASKLLLDFMLSKRGQLAWAKGGFTPVRPDIYGEAERSLGSVIKEVGEENIIYWEWAPELRDEKFVKEFHEKYMSALTGVK